MSWWRNFTRSWKARLSEIARLSENANMSNYADDNPYSDSTADGDPHYDPKDDAVVFDSIRDLLASVVGRTILDVSQNDPDEEQGYICLILSSGSSIKFYGSFTYECTVADEESNPQLKKIVDLMRERGWGPADESAEL